MIKNFYKKSILAVIISLVLSSCAMGPDFIRPKAPETEKYTHEILPKSLMMPDDNIQKQVFLSGKEISDDWWKLFNSQKLDLILKEVYEKNPSLKANYARLKGAREALVSQKSPLYPQVDFNFSALRQKTTGASFGQAGGAFDNTFTLYGAGFNVGYYIDAFGLVKRGIEAKEAQISYNESIIRGTYLTLTGNIITLAINEAFLREQEKALFEILDIQKRFLTLTQEKEKKGAGTALNVLNARAKITSTEALFPPINQSIAQIRHNLSILTGKPPSFGETLPEFYVSDFNMPMELPIALPSEFVKNRPDIVASENLLHISNAEIGIATANLYPNINLSGALLAQGQEIGNLIDPAYRIWTLGSSLVAPIFNAGKLQAEKRAAIARYEEALANYENTVLSAFSQVADVLVKIASDSKELESREKTLSIAKDSLKIAENLYNAGTSSYLDLLTAEETYINAKLMHIQTLQKRYADAAALFVVLGGGWDANKKI